MLYKANKLVSGNDQHITLDKNDKESFDIIEGTSIFMRIPI